VLRPPAARRGRGGGGGGGTHHRARGEKAAASCLAQKWQGQAGQPASISRQESPSAALIMRGFRAVLADVPDLTTSVATAS